MKAKDLVTEAKAKHFKAKATASTFGDLDFEAKDTIYIQVDI